MSEINVARKVAETITESIVNGFVQYEVSQTFQVFLAERTTPPSQTYLATGLPPLGQEAIAGPSGERVWCTRRVPSRVDTDATQRKFHVVCTFTNFTQSFERDQQGNPVTNPVDAVKRVDVSYLQHSEPVSDALLVNFTQDGREGADGATPIQTPPWLSGRTATPGPIVKSNGVPVFVERDAHRKVIAVSQVFRDWNNNWDTYTDSINTDTITIEERDYEGIRWSETFQPFTLKMRPPRKENIWKDRSLYFRRTMIMEYNPDTWIHSELDAGSKRRVFLGQNKPGGGTYTQSDLDTLGIDGQWGYQEITTKTTDGQDVAIGDPVRLNGFGMESPVSQPANYNVESQIFGNWYKHKRLPFAGLNL